MSITTEINKALISQLSQVYIHAENTILHELTKQVMKGTANGSWASQKSSSILNQHADIQKIQQFLDKNALTALETGIIDAYYEGAASVEKDFGLSKSIMSKTIIPAKVQHLILESSNLVKKANLRILREVDDVYREVQALVAPGLLTGIKTRKEIAQQALNIFADRGITGFIDKAGRKWELSSYVEMSTRTVSARASMMGHIDRQIEAGRDLVIISAHSGSCPTCAKYAGSVFSISGLDQNYPALNDAISGGLFHPNCRHMLTGYTEGLTDKINLASLTHSPEQYKYTQKQRATERAIRRWKRRDIVAMDPKESRKCKGKIAFYQGEQRALLKEYEQKFGITLRRKYDREGIKHLTGKVGTTKLDNWVAGKPMTFKEFQKNINSAWKSPKEIAELKAKKEAKALAHQAKVAPVAPQATMLKNPLLGDTISEAGAKAIPTPIVQSAKVLNPAVEKFLSLKQVEEIQDFYKPLQHKNLGDFMADDDVPYSLWKVINELMDDMVNNQGIFNPQDFMWSLIKNNELAEDLIALPVKAVAPAINQAVAGVKTAKNAVGSDIWQLQSGKHVTLNMVEALENEVMNDPFKKMSEVLKVFPKSYKEGMDSLVEELMKQTTMTKKVATEAIHEALKDFKLKALLNVDKAIVPVVQAPAYVETVFAPILKTVDIKDLKALEKKAQLATTNTTLKEWKMNLDTKFFDTLSEATAHYKPISGLDKYDAQQVLFDKLKDGTLIKELEASLANAKKTVATKIKVAKRSAGGSIDFDAIDINDYEYLYTKAEQGGIGLRSGSSNIVRDSKYWEDYRTTYDSGVQAVSDYTGSSYQDMNDAMRAKQVSGSYYEAQINKAWKALKQAGQDCPLEDNIVLYRHSGLSCIEDFFDSDTKELCRSITRSPLADTQALVDELKQQVLRADISDRAFLSTAYKEGVFLRDRGLELRILAPKGYNKGAFVESISNRSSEAEYIFLPETKFKIIDVEYKLVRDGADLSRAPNTYNIVFTVVPIT